MSDNNGVNILGYINKQFGLGEGVRSNIRALTAANVPFVINDFTDEIASDILEENTSNVDISKENPHKINLIQINFDNFDKVINSFGSSYLNGKYNIAFWAWELEHFPTDFQKYIDLMDEIWVPSNFCVNAISQVSSKPVLRFMHSIEIPQNNINREHLNLPEDRLIYLTIFDYHSTIARKNPYATIDAYEKAFGKNSQEAILIIKTSVGERFAKEKIELANYIKNNKSIVLIEKTLPREELNALINNCDVYVSLHRSEGFGLTMAEAMYFGKPVIATGYSANVEFMNNENSYLISYDLIPTSHNYFYSNLNCQWADANVNEASLVMRNLADNPSERIRIGHKAKKDIQNLLSPQHIGNKIKDRLNYISENCLLNSQNSDKEIIKTLKHENANLENKNNALKNIKAIKWKLAFKNLQNRISGKTKKYFWED